MEGIMMQQVNQMVPLFNPSMAMRAQISSGYKNTDYAIAEIIDNSIEAEASDIDIYIIQGYVAPSEFKKNGRRRNIVQRLIVVDNGLGIDPSILGNVLAFGYGTHLEPNASELDAFGKLGKFGYGLPNSSVASANNVNVWSWRHGIAQAMHTSLHVKAIIQGKEDHQTPAEQRAVDTDIIDLIRAVSFPLKETGTIVDWEDLERCTWKRASTLIDYVEETVGRIFRKFINIGKVKIRLIVFDKDNLGRPVRKVVVRVNDPMGLMPNSIAHSLLKEDDRANPCLSLFREWALSPQKRKEEFYYWSDGSKDYIEVPLGNGEVSVVTINYSIVNPFLRQVPPYGGRSPIGVLTARNAGVSICRAGRELMLSQNWIPSQDPTERWWGAEINFPPALDEMLGVSNNKQSAAILESYANLNLKVFREQYISELEDPIVKERIASDWDVIDDMYNNEDARWLPVLIRKLIYETTRAIKVKIDKMGASVASEVSGNNGGGKSPANPGSKYGGAEIAGSDVIVKEDPISEGGKTHTVEDVISITGSGVSDQRKKDVLEWLNSDSKVLFEEEESEDDHLFRFKVCEDKYYIILNTNHLGYDALFESVGFLIRSHEENSDVGQLKPEEIRMRLDRIRSALALLVLAFVRAESKDMSDQNKILRKFRQRMSERFSDLIEEFNNVCSSDGFTGNAEKSYETH